MLKQASRFGVDQPFVQTSAAGDRIYVGLNDFAPPVVGKTATVDLSSDGGTIWASARLEKRPTAGPVSGQDGPSIRPAVASNSSVVYAAFFGWRAFDAVTAIATADVVISRDDSGGFVGDPFTALVDTDGFAGKRIATSVTIPFSNAPALGQERIGSALSIAVDPSNSAIVYVAWGDRTGTDIQTLHLRRSINSGATWTNDLRTLSNATNPALAINGTGLVALLYQQVVTVSGTPRWQTHLVQLSNGIVVNDDGARQRADVHSGSGVPALPRRLCVRDGVE